MMGGLDRVLFNPAVNTFLTTVHNPESNIGLVSKDLFCSTERIHQEYARNSHGGRESLIEEVLTTGVWGAGLPLGKKLMDWAAPRLSNGSILLPNLDLQLLQKSNPQHLTDDLIKQYFIPEAYPHLSPQKFNAVRQNLQTLAKNVSENAGPEAKRLLGSNNVFQISKVAGVGFCTALVLGFGIPKLNQHITRAFLQREQEKQANQQNGEHPPASVFGPAAGAFSLGALSKNAFSTGALPSPFANPFNGTLNTGFHPKGLQHLKQAFPHVFPQTSPPGSQAGKHSAQPVHFGGSAELASAILQKLNQNDQLSTLFFSDLPLSTGRAATTRNYDEFWEKSFKEAAIIATLFGVMPYAEKWLAGMRKDVGFHGMKYLRDRYQGDGVSFKADYEKLQKALNLKGKPLAAHIPDSQNKNATSEVVSQIRNYFHMNKAAHHGDNLLYAMAEANGKIPTVEVSAPKAKAAIKHIDITRQIDLDGIKSIAAFLDRLALAQGKQGFKNELTRQALQKTGAFAGATMIGFGLMSYLIPKVQHQITYVRTGKDYFPGVKDAPEATPKPKPNPSMPPSSTVNKGTPLKTATGFNQAIYRQGTASPALTA